MVAHPVLKAIAAHTQAVERGEVDCTFDRCSTCGCPGPFKCHACRRRTFRVILGRVVHQVAAALTRWKCGGCGKTFTFYPDFALPYKRYVRQDVLRLTGRYVSQESVSYHKAVQVNGMAVCYDATAGQNEGIDERVLWASTVHRWIGFLGDLKQTLGQAWQLIRAKSPTCEAFRRMAPVPSWKYRSEQRKSLLQRAARLLQADGAYRNLFQTSIFPYLATVCRWS